jgi:hypothetical protein
MQAKIYFIEWNVITLNGSSIIMTFLFDWMSLLFMGFVLIVSSLVILYRDDYIFGDLNIIRFILLVLIFVISIILLIISPNLISILLGWDGLGLVSYLLVIYYQNAKCTNSANHSHCAANRDNEFDRIKKVLKFDMNKRKGCIRKVNKPLAFLPRYLTLTPLMWNIGRALNNVRKW